MTCQKQIRQKNKGFREKWGYRLKKKLFFIYFRYGSGFQCFFDFWTRSRISKLFSTSGFLEKSRTRSKKFVYSQFIENILDCFDPTYFMVGIFFYMFQNLIKWMKKSDSSNNLIFKNIKCLFSALGNVSKIQNFFFWKKICQIWEFNYWREKLKNCCLQFLRRLWKVLFSQSSLCHQLNSKRLETIFSFFRFSIFQVLYTQTS